MMAGVMQPEIMGTVEVRDGSTWPSQGNVAPRGSMRFRDRTAVSICIYFITSVGVVMMRHVSSSLEMERSVGKKGGPVSHAVSRIINFSAALGSFTHIRSKTLPYTRWR